ncbi:MAG: cytochrome P450 [Verrucomicrobia bacterium]|nr:cytochrome P450 [Verrucomicrobiota bacterium]
MSAVCRWAGRVESSLWDRLPLSPAAYARARGLLSRHPLPPGDLVPLDEPERRNRDHLRQRSEVLGPVFKGIAWDALCICILGIDRCRRFTQTHRESLRVQTLELDHLIPGGFLCAMEGDQHRETRKATHRALRGACPNGDPEGPVGSVLRTLAETRLARHVQGAPSHAHSADAFTMAMTDLATEMLAWIYFGSRPDTAEMAQLLGHFRELGPYGLVWNPQRRQEVAFQAFREEIHRHADALRSGTSGLSDAGLLAQMVRAGALDETQIGNLIYQAEMARSDIKNFLRWLTCHAADHPEVLDRLAEEAASGSRECPRIASFVQETLRTDQSERMMRVAVRDIVFDGFLIPRRAVVRLCLWESHQDPGAFPEPRRFDPDRFLKGDPGSDQYAPFGVDHHQCPMGGVVVQIGEVFLNALARGYRVTPLVAGAPVRAAYHWEPAPRFAVQLLPR